MGSVSRSHCQIMSVSAQDAALELFANPAPCPACSDYNLTVLGKLGDRIGCRCRSCGYTFTVSDEEEAV